MGLAKTSIWPTGCFWKTWRRSYILSFLFITTDRSVNYATRTFSAIYFLQFSRKEQRWQSFNLGFQLGEKEQKKDLRCSICTAIYLFTIHYFLNALSWKQNSECSLSFSALKSIPHCCSVLTFQDPSKQLALCWLPAGGWEAAVHPVIEYALKAANQQSPPVSTVNTNPHIR